MDEKGVEVPLEVPTPPFPSASSGPGIPPIRDLKVAVVFNGLVGAVILQAVHAGGRPGDRSGMMEVVQGERAQERAKRGGLLHSIRTCQHKANGYLPTISHDFGQLLSLRVSPSCLCPLPSHTHVWPEVF